MAAWVVRAGFAKTGDFEFIAFGRNVAVINFGLHGNVSDFPTKQELRGHLLARAPDWYGYDSTRKAGYAANQLWKFANDIAVRDTVLIPNSGRRVVAVGRVSQGPVRHLHVEEFPDCFQVRPVDWKAKDIPMMNFGRDLIRALGERPTVFQPNVLDAVAQFEDILEKYLTS
jgi:predicted Mrr-cat superfamily restriction endonuclease